MTAFRFKMLFEITLVFLSFSQLNSQNLSLVTPICNNNGTITYSMYANVTDYLLNNNNIDKRNYYNRPTDLQTRTIGILPGFPITGTYGNIITFPSTEDMIEALRNHTIDGIVVDKSVNDYIILHNYDTYKIPEKTGQAQYGVIFQKDSDLVEKYNDFASKNNIQSIMETWNGINYDGQTIDKNLNGNNGTLKAISYLGNRPYAYKDANGNPTGSCLDIIYSFAKSAGYKVDFKEASSYDAQINGIKDKNYDISCAYINDSLKNDVSPGNNIPSQDTFPIVRLSNSAASNENDKELYETYKDLDGKKLGVLTDSVFEDINKRNFSKSEYSNYNDSFLLYKALFTGEIEGFLTDVPSAEDFQRRFPEKVSYFGENFYTNYYGFGFQKNNSALVNEFNNFLKTQNLTELYPKWNVRDTSNLTVDKTLPSNPKKTIRVAMFPDTKPICFEQNNDVIGYEVYLIYEFARARNYSIDFITLENSGDRVNYLLENKADIGAGALTITEERREVIDYSYPTLTAGTALVVSRENRKLPGKIQSLDENYQPIENNTIYFPVKVGNTNTVSSCVFPESYPYGGLALINCTISNLNGTDPTRNGLVIGTSNDTLGLNNVEYSPTNLLNGNTLLGRNIITESNKTDYICYVASPSTQPVTISSTVATTVSTTTSSAIKNSTYNYYKTSKKGLSTGAIIGIIIPCVVALLAATIGAFLCRRGKAVPGPAYAQRLDTSNYKLNVAPQYPMQEIQVHQVPVTQVVPVEHIVPVQHTVQVQQVVPGQQAIIAEQPAVIVNNP